MIGFYKLYVHIQRVQASFAHADYSRLNLMSLAYADMASEHWDQKVERESYRRYDQHEMFTIENYSINMRYDRTWFSWFGSRDHLDD